MESYTTYRVAVDENTDFLEGWTDSSVPHMVFLYDQESLEECELENGVYYATYKSVSFSTPRTFEIAGSSGATTIAVPAGEYGVKP
jgi:hypothetical protein